MSQISTIVNALIMLPVGAAIDGVYARQCLRHIERRGYELAGIVHDWSTALTKLRADEAEVVVFARLEHFEPDWTPRIEYVGDETRDLAKPVRPPRNEGPGDGRHRRPRPA